MKSKDIIIREARLEDIELIRLLSNELGYPSTAEQIKYRLEKIINSESDAVFVTVENNITIGWIHIFGTIRLESGSFAEIGGLVVSSGHRNKRIGKALVKEAEKWAQEKGYKILRVRSRTSRKDAHRFYEKEGYKMKKEQAVFEKIL